MVMEHGRLGLSVLRRTVVLSGWMAQKLKRMGAANLVENQYVAFVRGLASRRSAEVRRPSGPSQNGGSHRSVSTLGPRRSDLGRKPSRLPRKPGACCTIRTRLGPPPPRTPPPG